MEKLAFFNLPKIGSPPQKKKSTVSSAVQLVYFNVTLKTYCIRSRLPFKEQNYLIYTNPATRDGFMLYVFDITPVAIHDPNKNTNITIPPIALELKHMYI